MTIPGFDLILDLHIRQDRQGPGSDIETRRALDLARIDRSRKLSVSDLGSGTGASTLVLANELDAHVTAVDFAPGFVDRLRERADQAGLSAQISAMVGEMQALPFNEEQFDVIWSEGAIYNIGFAEGLRAWRRFLRPGGVIGVSELTWTTSQRPAEIEAHWGAEYPGIATAPQKLEVMEAEGYEPLGMFFLPRDCWEEHYYTPLSAAFAGFLDRHGASEAARELVSAEQAEIDLYRRFGRWYSYGFYIARRPGACG